MSSLRSQQFHLLLVVAACHLFLPPHAMWLVPTPKGKIEKAHNMYYVGDNLTVLCIKFSDFTGDVYFQQGNMNYSPEYVTQINTTHALLDKPVTDDDFKETSLTCADGDGLVATDTLYTDYAPQNATDLKMEWLNEENLTINWGFNNTPYKNGHTDKLILVTGEWCFNTSSESNWGKCYRGKLNNATCKVSNIPSEWATVYVRVNMTNVKRDDTVTTVFPGVPVRDHVKPLPVESVQVTARNSTAVRVNLSSIYNKQVYNITYYTTSGEEESHTTVMTNKTDNKSFDVAGLHPDYSYLFSVSSKYDTDRGYLSDPVKSSVTQMPEDAPAAGPVVTPGGFYLDRSLCSSEADSAKKKTTAYVYFQELAEKDKNGKIVRYTATVVVDGKNVTYTQSGTPRTVKLDSVRCDGNFNVTLHAHTAVGPSPGAVLHVPQWSKGKDGSVDKLMLKQSDGNITAEWEATPSQPGVSVLLYYCDKTSSDTNMCQQSIRHVNISTDSGSHLLPSANANMKFGMAAVSSDSSTKGIQFTDCLYDPTTDPGNPLEVNAFAQSDDILVSWKALSACDSTRRYIIFNFEIEVCNTETATNDPNRCKKYTVSASSNNYRLDGVAKDVNYSVKMRANTTSANQPLTDFTDPVFATVQSTVFKLSSGEIAGIAMGVLAVVFVLGMLVFCFCRDKFRALRSKFKKPADIVNPPANPTPKKAVNGFDDDVVGHSNPAYIDTSSSKVLHDQQMSGDSGYSGHNDSPPHSPTEDKTQVIPESRPAGYTMVTTGTGQNPYMPNTDTVGLIPPSADQADVSGIVLSVANQPLGQSPAPFFPLPVPACLQEDHDKDSDEDSDKDKDECLNDDSHTSEAGNGAYMRCSTADTVPDGAQPPGASTASDTTPPAARPDPAVTQPVINFVLADLPAIPVPQDFLDEPDLEDEDGMLKEAGPRSEHNPAADSTLQDNYMRVAAASDTTEPGQDGVHQMTAQPGEEASFFPSGDNHSTAPQDTEHQGKDALPAGDGNGSGYIERSPLSLPNVESTQEVEACLPGPTPQEGAVNPGYVSKETIANHNYTYQPNPPAGEDESQQNPQDEILTDLSASTQNPLPSTRSELSHDESLAASECEGSNPEASRQRHPAPLAPSSTAGYLPHPLPPVPAADPQSGPSQRHAEQEGGNTLDNDLNHDLAAQGQPDVVPSEVSSGYVARPEEICDVPQPSSQPVFQEGEGGEEGSTQPVVEDAAQCDGSDSGASSMSDADHGLSSNGSGYAPHQVTLTSSDGLQSPPDDSSVRIEVTGDRPSTNNTSYISLEATLTPGSGELWQPDDGTEDSGNRLTLERLDSGYFSPCATLAARPLFSSDSGQDKVQAADYKHQAHHTDLSSTHNAEHGETVTTGEGVGGERQGGTLGGTLIMSGRAALTSSGYVNRKDAPPATSTTSV